MLLLISEGINSFTQFFTVLLIFLFVLGITYFTTRYIAGVHKSQIKNSNMELIDSLRISNNKYLQIVRVGNKYLCVAVCKDIVTMLVELEEDDIKISNTLDVTFNFQNIFEKIKKESGAQK